MTREHPFAAHRVVPVAVVLGLALVAFAAVRGPAWYQRLYHPLKYASDIAATARSAGLDPYLVAAVVNVESGFSATEVSPRGAVGLMQVLPSTAHEIARQTGLKERVTAETLLRPGTNLRVGTRYLGALSAQYGDVAVALAAYNGGLANAERWVAKAKRDGKPFREVVDFPETRHYIDEVLAQRDVYAQLYPDAFKGAK